MSVKLAVLKSGEHVIADIKELVDSNEKVVSLVFENPYVVNLLTPKVLFESNGEVEKEQKVSFYPWIVLSSDKTIAIDPSWVVCVVEAHEMVKNSYLMRMSGDVEDEDDFDEYDDFDDFDESDELDQQETLIENFEVIVEEKNG